ncbi:MAG: FHA domain-containing protein [bacterium]|nr:FHA domain-containing protein [bacterium]
MSQRYSLRFESGERAGETIPITGTVFSIGRRPGNSLQILENSVSGKHAELHVDDRGILLRDVGSTNGTRIGEARVLESRIEPGARVIFGNVAMSFLDTEAPEAAAAQPTPEADAVDHANENTPELRVSAENLARAKRGSKLGLVLIVSVLAAGGAAAAYFLKGGSGGAGERLRPVASPEGNLLENGYSFEGETSTWESRDSLPASFSPTPRARYSGEMGISASLEAGEAAVHRSGDVRVAEGKSFEARAEVRAPGDVLGRLGIQFFSLSEGPDAPQPATAWSAGVADESAFGELMVQTTVPAGYDRARVLVLASAAPAGEGGRVDFDDVAMTPAGSGAPTSTIDEYRFYTLGDAALEASLFKVDRVLISNLRFKDAEGVGRGFQRIDVSEEDNGLRIRHGGSGSCTFSFLAEPGAIQGGLAGIGKIGYSTINADIEATMATDVLLGGGVDLVRVSFGTEVELKGRVQGTAYRIQVELPAGADVLVQLRFREERAAAIAIAAEADDARDGGRLGECIAKWQTLLDRYPYEEQAVVRGQETISELVQGGIEEVRAVEGEVERARFFRLVDLYRECRASAETVAQRYAGSDVEKDAHELTLAIDGDLKLLEAKLDEHEVQRLRSILAALEATESEGLAAEVRAYLENHYGESR